MLCQRAFSSVLSAVFLHISTTLFNLGCMRPLTRQVLLSQHLSQSVSAVGSTSSNFCHTSSNPPSDIGRRLLVDIADRQHPVPLQARNSCLLPFRHHIRSDFVNDSFQFPYIHFNLKLFNYQSGICLVCVVASFKLSCV